MWKPASSHRLILALLILSGVLWRCYRAGEPLFDSNWTRQYDSAALARNFAEGRMNILYPRADWGGDTPGYVETEFPLHSFLVACLYRVFGVHEWLGRALSILFWAVAAFLFHGLVRRWAGEHTALLSVFFYAFVPLSFHARNFQPEMLMCLCALAAVDCFWRWCEQDQRKYLLLSGAALALALLVKLPSAHIGLPILFLCWRRFGWGLFRRWEPWAYSVAAWLPALLWYGHAHQLGMAYGNSFQGAYFSLGYPEWGDPVWGEMLTQFPRRIALDMATPPGLLFLALGWVWRPRRSHPVLNWWALGFLINILLLPYAYARLNYYSLPALFFFCAWMARGAAELWERLTDRRALQRVLVAGLCISTVAFSLWLIERRTRLSDFHRTRMQFGQRVQDLTEPGTLIIFLKEGSLPGYRQHRFAPGFYLCSEATDFYLSRRRGWCVDYDQATPELLETLRKRGARYLADVFPLFLQPGVKQDNLKKRLTAVEVTARWAIYRLEAPAKDPARP